VDDQHKAMKTRQGKPALEKIMSELVDYTVMHFGMELINPPSVRYTLPYGTVWESVTSPLEQRFKPTLRN